MAFLFGHRNPVKPGNDAAFVVGFFSRRRRPRKWSRRAQDTHKKMVVSTLKRTSAIWRPSKTERFVQPTRRETGPKKKERNGEISGRFCVGLVGCSYRWPTFNSSSYNKEKLIESRTVSGRNSVTRPFLFCFFFAFALRRPSSCRGVD